MMTALAVMTTKAGHMMCNKHPIAFVKVLYAFAGFHDCPADLVPEYGTLRHSLVYGLVDIRAAQAARCQF
jgi:hypothetical protein